MSDNLSYSISNAILVSSHAPGSARPKASVNKLVVPRSRKATEKTHYVGEHAFKTGLMNRLHPVPIEDVGPPCKRVTHRATAMRTWKRAKALTDFSNSGSDSEEVLDESNGIGSIDSGNSSLDSHPRPTGRTLV
ncbi:Hypothetical predicted protein [Pelobates cultripes]|uniref:Uncharacterized protein n=1 Tax=Pelobates cultripes TaxID=61616 RepID=A0AAD1WMU6_PELCU|nr:Hypothetical predicted protein [Pelobates cultripes]CAH2315055.1 Hypothetical predicted protein [Pelobates cultripes]